MKPLLAFILFLALLATLVMAFPDFLISPGRLMKGHQQLNNECLSCHAPFRGIASFKCNQCHKIDEIGAKTVAGEIIARDSSKVLFHRYLPESACISCHSDHKGSDAHKAIKPFVHALLAKKQLSDCLSCHKAQLPKDTLHSNVDTQNCLSCHTSSSWKPAVVDHEKLPLTLTGNCTLCHKGDIPDEELHRQLNMNCNVCHSTKSWKPATFEHKDLPAALQSQCVKCHSKGRPNDEQHSSSDSNCAACHGTRSWKPATFNHDRYFSLDGDHRASCRTCHPSGKDYKQYTCYGCHEHTAAKIERQHIREGIRNFQNCVKCHRDGGEGGEHGEGSKRSGDRGDDD